MPEKKCTGECLKCSFQQQTYCSAQRTYAMMLNQEAIVARLDRLEAMLSGFSTKEIIPLEDKAQNGAGADNREPEQPQSIQ
jgi:hypothetical protein